MGARKNPHAVALGRRGGKANTAAQQAARRENGAKGGQRRRYRLVGKQLQRRDGETWSAVPEPFDRACREALRRLRAGHRQRYGA